MGCPFVKSRLHVVETLDKRDPDSIQIKTALLDQIKEHEGCQDEPDQDYPPPPPLEWPTDDDYVPVPDSQGSHAFGVASEYDFVGYEQEDDIEVGVWLIYRVRQQVINYVV